MSDSFEQQLADGIRRLGSETSTHDAVARLEHAVDRTRGLPRRRSGPRELALPALVAAAVAGLVAVPLGLSAWNAGRGDVTPARGSLSSPASSVGEVTLTAEQACPANAPIKEFPASLAEVDAAYRCVDLVEEQRVSVARITSGLGALAVAYRGPNLPYVRGQKCDFSTPDPLRLWVHTDDRVFQVIAPRDGCGEPTAPAVDAYKALGTKEASGG